MWVAAGLAFLLALIAFLAFSGPSVRLRLAGLTGVARPQLQSVHSAMGGLVLAERVGLAQGGELGRIWFVSADGRVRHRLFDRERRVLGITGPLVWTDGEGRPSLRLPSLEDGPRQLEVTRRCGLTAVEVRVAREDAALIVTADDGTIWLCDPLTGERRVRGEPAARPRPTTPRSTLEQAGHRAALRVDQEVVASDLLDARIPVDCATGEALAVDGDVFVEHRSSLAPGSPVLLGRYGVGGRRWTAELRADGCTIEPGASFAIVDRALLVAGQAEGGTCVLRLDLDDGRALWARVLSQ